MALEESQADTVIFDDELKPGQSRALEKALGSNISLCDRTALILDIFSQRAASREGHLQVCFFASCQDCEYYLNIKFRLQHIALSDVVRDVSFTLTSSLSFIALPKVQLVNVGNRNRY